MNGSGEGRIAVVKLKGGVGKATTSILIATQLVASGAP